jgi:predicted transcriptional regulator
MRALWAQPGATVAQVAEAMRPARDLAHTTVATLLSRLEKRGLAASARDGRQLIYRALVTERQIKSSMVSRLVSGLFQGKPGALLSHLLRTDEIGASDLAQIRALLDRKERGDE